MNITVYGAASHKIDNSYIKEVEQLGEELIKRGHNLIYGGGAQGLMGAIARGAYKHNGKIIGISPLIFKDIDGELFEHCEMIFTNTMRERKQLLDDYADAFISVPGGIGTFEELFEIISAKQLNIINKPIVIYNINGYYNTFHQMINEAIDKQFIHSSNKDLYLITNDINEVFDYIENYDKHSSLCDYRHV